MNWQAFTHQIYQTFALYANKFIPLKTFFNTTEWLLAHF